MNAQDLNRVADAVEQISVDSIAAVVAVKRHDGQITIFNVGDLDSRKQIYGIIGSCKAAAGTTHLLFSTGKEDNA